MEIGVLLIPTFLASFIINEENNFNDIEENEEEKRLPKCNFNQIYKQEFVMGDKKMDTLVRCECDGHYQRDYTVRKDPFKDGQYIRTHRCFGAVSNITDPCGEYARCRVDIRQNYGISRNGTYTDERRTYCKCEPNRMNCTSTHESKYVTEYACLYPLCMEHDLCRIMEYSGSPELQRNITTFCHCTGECSYRPWNSIIYSREYRNATHYYTCKFPSSSKEKTTNLLEETEEEDLCASRLINKF